jgi:hypothetical protein
VCVGYGREVIGCIGRNSIAIGPLGDLWLVGMELLSGGLQLVGSRLEDLSWFSLVAHSHDHGHGNLGGARFPRLVGIYSHSYRSFVFPNQ